LYINAISSLPYSSLDSFFIKFIQIIMMTTAHPSFQNGVEIDVEEEIVNESESGN
jgi:hypothetical protein